MGFLIDTSVLIAAERGRCSLADLVCDLAGESLALAAITASELLHGVHRAIDPNVAEKRSRFVEYILDLFPVLPFDLETARVHAELWVALQRGGQVIGAHDLIIAATALGRRLRPDHRQQRGVPARSRIGRDQPIGVRGFRTTYQA